MKNVWLSNTKKSEAVELVRIFKELEIGEPKKEKGYTWSEHQKFGIVGIYGPEDFNKVR